MHASDIVAYACEGELYCPDHIDPTESDLDQGFISPVFADSEGWQGHACFTCIAEAIEAGEQPETLGEFYGEVSR